MKPPVLILHATGTNRDREAAWACELAGGAPDIVHVERLASGEVDLLDYRMLVLPGGFSYGDDLGAGKVWAVLLRTRLAEPLARFLEAGRPALGICNGFQALVAAGLLAPRGEVTLTHNDSGRFECRWVTLLPDPTSPCVFTRDLREPILCPVAHGEGKLVAASPRVEDALVAGGRVALRYYPTPDAPGGYPGNPNGSFADAAGLTNAEGTVLGLMPHPEDHLVPDQHPRVHRGERGGSGLALFAAGLRYAADL